MSLQLYTFRSQKHSKNTIVRKQRYNIYKYNKFEQHFCFIFLINKVVYSNVWNSIANLIYRLNYIKTYIKVGRGGFYGLVFLMKPKTALNNGFLKFENHHHRFVKWGGFFGSAFLVFSVSIRFFGFCAHP